MNVSHLNMVRRMAVVVWALALVASLTACSYFTDVTSAGAELELAGDAMPEVANASASEFNNEGSIYLKGTFILVKDCTRDDAERVINALVDKARTLEHFEELHVEIYVNGQNGLLP